jgi:3-dehydroquinate synthase
MTETVTVNTGSGKYDVVIGSGLDYGQLAQRVLKPCRVVIVSDDNVFPLYGKAAVNSFSVCGFQTDSYVIKHGEASKTLANATGLLEYLAEIKLTRGDCLTALGGGVVGDMTGFAAAVFLRGIKFIQLPTTLLAAVDSSVGGKTGVDMPAGKNLVGAFHQPAAVFCDTNTFNTLPREVYSDGMAEVIKHCVIGDREMLATLAGLSPVEICKRNVQIKAGIVERDEFEKGERMQLNFGHTVGHGVEKLSGYKISHGSAVAIGMAVVTRAAERLGWTAEPCLDLFMEALESNRLPTACEYGPKELAEAALSDKKRSGDYISLVVPERIGKVSIKPIAVTRLEEFIALGYK